MWHPVTVTYCMWHYSTSTMPSINSSSIMDSCHKVTRSERSVYANSTFTAILSPNSQMPNLEKNNNNNNNKKVPVPPLKTNKQSREIYKIETKIQSCLWRKMLAFIQKSFTDGSSPPRFLLCRPPISVPMQSHGLDQGKIQRAAPPKACPKTQARGGVGRVAGCDPPWFKYGMRVTENNLQNRCMNECTTHEHQQKCTKLLRRLPCIFSAVSESNRTTTFSNIFIFNTGAMNM